MALGSFLGAAADLRCAGGTAMWPSRAGPRDICHPRIEKSVAFQPEKWNSVKGQARLEKRNAKGHLRIERWVYIKVIP